MTGCQHPGKIPMRQRWRTRAHGTVGIEIDYHCVVCGHDWVEP